MTKEQAIEKIEELVKYMKESDKKTSPFEFEILTYMALDIAIKALEQQPSDDCVSRAEVIKVLNEHWLSGGCARRIIDEQIEKVKALSPVTPTYGLSIDKPRGFCAQSISDKRYDPYTDSFV